MSNRRNNSLGETSGNSSTVLHTFWVVSLVSAPSLTVCSPVMTPAQQIEEEEETQGGGGGGEGRLISHG